jgi:hypothetical protein
VALLDKRGGGEATTKTLSVKMERKSVMKSALIERIFKGDDDRLLDDGRLIIA